MAETKKRKRGKRGHRRFSRDPNVWGLITGSVVATAAYCLAVYLQWPYPVLVQPAVLVGVFLTFVIGYGLGGVCAALLVSVFDRELPARESKVAHLSGRVKAAATEAQETEAAPGTEPSARPGAQE